MGLLQKVSTIEKPKIPDPDYKPLTDLAEIPIPAYQFSIIIDADTVALFQNCSGIQVSREVETYQEGGHNEFGYEFPKGISYSHVTFEGGLTSSTFFYEWMMEGYLDGRARAKDFTLVQRRHNPKGDTPTFEEVRKWDFFNAFPVSWKMSDLSLGDAEKIVLETLELSFDRFEPGTV